MPKKLNLIGKKFGNLTVIDEVGYRNKKVYWLCRCNCGNLCEVPTGNLRSGNTTSCGCVHKELTSKLFKIHGQNDTRLYVIWCHIKQRCYNEHCKEHKYYGERNIKMCGAWLNDFMNFYNWAINNGYDDTLTIDRINVNGNYEPNNCRWITQKQQTRNRRSNVIFTYKCKTKCLADWCETLGLNRRTVYSRIYRNWSIEKALELEKENKGR